MKRWGKCFAALMGVVFLAFAGKMTVKAAEVPAPFTADQLMAVVNAQCANVSSLQQVLAENVQMTEASSGLTISADLVMDVQQNRTVSHSATSMVMSMMGMSQGAAFENYSILSGATLWGYTSEQPGVWKAAYETLSPAELASCASPFGISGIDTATAAVVLDGNICRVRGVMDAASMDTVADLLESSGIAAGGVFPVVLDIDTATMLPLSMTVTMQNMVVSDMPGVTAAVNIVVTFGGYNQYDGLTVPAAVIASAA